MSTSIPIRAPTRGRISCATASTWVPTLNTCGFSSRWRANASNCPVSLRRAPPSRHRVDVAAAPLFRQFAAAQEIGRGADDGQEIVEIVRHAAVNCPTASIFWRSASRLAALGATTPPAPRR